MEDKNKINISKKPEIEAVKLTSDDLSLTPERFKEDGKPAQLVSGWTWGHLQEAPGSPYIIHMREFGAAGLSMNYGIVRMGDTPLSKHVGFEHCLEMYPPNNPDANPNTPFPAGYDQVFYTPVEGDPDGCTNDPFTYELRAGNTELLYRFSSKYTRVVEADFLDVTYENMPYALVLNANGALGVPYIQQHAIVTGTFEGRKVRYFGTWDRMYSGTVSEGLAGNVFSGISFGGIRSDGCREWGMVAKVGKDSGFAYYCKDGEEPVITTDVKMEANWIRLPYVNDGTMVFTKATYEFAGKVIHYDAKWGGRGQNYKQLTWPGFSQTGGVWYEGSTPNKFEVSFAYPESHNALEEKVIEAGFLS